MLHWLRKVRVTLQGSAGTFVVNPGGVQQHEIKVAFSVSRTISSEPNDATITIWNLAEAERNAIGKEFDTITLEAGYEDQVGVIFRGQIRDVEHTAKDKTKKSAGAQRRNVQTTRQGLDIETQINLGDGDAALRRAVISQTFPAGTPVEDVIEGIYKELEAQGLSRGEWALPEDILKEYKRPYTVYGKAAPKLNLLSRSHRFYWSIQNGVVEIIPHNGALPGTIYISEQSGMIEAPTVTDNGIIVRSLLNPAARPNRTMTVQSSLVNLGSNPLYRISAVDFYGDNHSGDYEMRLTGETLSGGKVDEGVGVDALIAAARKALPV